MELGRIGSIKHINSNERVKDQEACTKAVLKSNTKDEFLTLAGATATAGATFVAAKKVPVAAKYLQKGVSYVGDLLGKVSINGNSLKGSIEKNSLFQKIAKHGTAGKAALLTGAIALGVGSVLKGKSSAAKSGYIEKSYEK